MKVKEVFVNDEQRVPRPCPVRDHSVWERTGNRHPPSPSMYLSRSLWLYPLVTVPVHVPRPCTGGTRLLPIVTGDSWDFLRHGSV